jgi:hypothetical protein
MRDISVARKNIEDALKALDSKVSPLRLPSTETEVIEALTRSSETLGIPTFSRDGSEIRLSDPQTFDYSVFGESIASFSIGLDQCLVALGLASMGHQVFETFAWYSAAYQFLDSILSIRGIHFLYKPLSPFVVRKERRRVNGELKEIMETKRRYFELPIILAENNGGTWSFRPTNLSHEIRWDKFGMFLISLVEAGKSKEIPDDVKRLYGYLKAIDDYKKHRLEWREFKIDLPTNGSLMSAIASYGKGIAEIRHQAVYQNRSYDVFAYAALSSNAQMEEFTKARMTFVRKFTYALARWNAEMLSEIWSYLKGMKPYPASGVDWLELACAYIPLRMHLTQVRLDEIVRNPEIMSIHASIPDIITDILASLNIREW